MAKKYYWLKFQKDFFKSLRIKRLRKLAGGDTFTIIYLKLQLLSLTSNGVLEYKGVFSTFEDEMEEEIGESADNIKVTINYLLSCGLMEHSGNKYFLPYVPINTGSESDSAERVRNFRDKQKTLQCNADLLHCNTSVTECNTEKEKEIEIEIDIDNNNTIGDFDKQNSQDSSTVDDFFNSIWKLYPKKLGKGSVGKTKKKVLQRIGFEHMQRCIKRYVDEFNASGQDMKFMQYGSTFFNSGYVDYLDENWKERHEPVEKKVNQPTNTVQSSSNRFDCLSEALKNKLISQDAICVEDESVNFANLDEEDMQTLKELKVI